MNDVTENVIADFFKSHPAMIMTLLFLQVSAVGLVYDYSLLKEFGLEELGSGGSGKLFVSYFTVYSHQTRGGIGPGDGSKSEVVIVVIL